MHLFPWNYSSSEDESSNENLAPWLIFNLWKGKNCHLFVWHIWNLSSEQKPNSWLEVGTANNWEIEKILDINLEPMEKIDNIQKEDIATESITKEVPSESEYETETDDEVKF